MSCSYNPALALVTTLVSTERLHPESALPLSRIKDVFTSGASFRYRIWPLWSVERLLTRSGQPLWFGRQHAIDTMPVMNVGHHYEVVTFLRHVVLLLFAFEWVEACQTSRADLIAWGMSVVMWWFSRRRLLYEPLPISFLCWCMGQTLLGVYSNYASLFTPATY